MQIVFIILAAMLGVYAGAVLLYQTYLYNFTDYLERKENDDSNKGI